MDDVSRSDFGRAYKGEALKLLALQRGHAVVDIGCGPGDDAIEFARAVGPTGRVLGIDHHEVMIEQARRRAVHSGSLAEFRCIDVANGGEPDASFDRCYADRVLQLLGEVRERVAAEVLRMLKPGGHWVVCAPDTGSFLLDIGEREITPKITQFVANRGWPGRILANWMRDSGFVQLQLRAYSNWTTDFESVDANTPLKSLAQWACEADQITGDECKLWLEALDAAVEHDRFSFCSTILVARGSRPDTPAD